MDRLLPWLRRSGWAYVAVAIALALVAWRVGGGGGGGGGQPSPAAAVTTPVTSTAPSGASGLVHVVGAVRHPGVYRIVAGARVVEVIRRAGGPTRHADLAALNLAAPLEDGQQVLVPVKAPPQAAAAPGVAPAAAAAGPIRLATATPAQLEALDGIGPALAARIIEWRDAHGGFRSVDGLLEVPGIGPARLEAIRTDVVP